MPALRRTASQPPARAQCWSNAAASALLSVTSQHMNAASQDGKSAREDAAASPSAVDRSSSVRVAAPRSASKRAVARPRPDAPPVMSTRAPARRMAAKRQARGAVGHLASPTRVRGRRPFDPSIWIGSAERASARTLLALFRVRTRLRFVTTPVRRCAGGFYFERGRLTVALRSLSRCAQLALEPVAAHANRLPRCRASRGPSARYREGAALWMLRASLRVALSPKSLAVALPATATRAVPWRRGRAGGCSSLGLAHKGTSDRAAVHTPTSLSDHLHSLERA